MIWTRLESDIHFSGIATYQIEERLNVQAEEFDDARMHQSAYTHEVVNSQLSSSEDL